LSSKNGKKLTVFKLAAFRLGWEHLKERAHHKLLSKFITGRPPDKSNYMPTNESAADQLKLLQMDLHTTEITTN
jgi:hypothetical protein